MNHMVDLEPYGSGLIYGPRSTIVVQGHYVKAKVNHGPKLSTNFHCIFVIILVFWFPYLDGYTECPRRNVPEFGRVFLMLKYTDITQNIQS